MACKLPKFLYSVSNGTQQTIRNLMGLTHLKIKK